MIQRFVLGTAAVVALAGWSPAMASPPDQQERVVVTERMQLTAFNPATGEGTQHGTFVAAGALNDAGVASATFRLTPRADGCSVLNGPHTLAGASGTITVFTTGLLCPSSPPNPPRWFASGTWRVIAASGAYVGVHGRGKIVATADFATGEITIARDGKVERDE
jgi:hypothetical protein